MKRLLLAVFLISAVNAFAGENTCTDSSGNFTAPACNTNGGISIAAPTKTIDAMTAIGTWAAFSNDTTGAATDLDSPMGGGSVEYDKVDGAGNTVFGAVTKTLSSVNLSGFGAKDRIQWNIYMSAITNVSYAFVRLGTSASHYNEWRVPVAQLATGWQAVSVEIGNTTGNTGNGWTSTDIDYVVIGTAHTAESDALADVRLNNLVAVGNVGAQSTVITSILPGTGATNLGKAEDAAHTSADVGIMALAVRNTNLSPLCGTTGDYCPLMVNDSGALYVENLDRSVRAEDGASSGGHNVNAIGGIRDDALTSGAEVTTDQDYTWLRVDNYGALWTHPLATTVVLTGTPTIEAAAYASGDAAQAAAEALTGTAYTAPFLCGRVTDVVVTDLAAQASNLDLILFSADPGAFSAAINAAADIADDDLAKVIAVIPVTAHTALNDNSISQATNVNVKYCLAAATAMYYGVVVRGAPTYASVADLVVRVKVELD